MKCPHCLENFQSYFIAYDLAAGTGPTERVTSDYDNVRFICKVARCPGCERFVLHLVPTDRNGNAMKTILVWPKGIARSPLPKEVPTDFANDYLEACTVLSDSPKASAALSRRCLQHVLREKAGVKKGDLAKEIEQVIPILPSHLASAIDAVRHVGNFAAHPLKSTNSGEILDVEPGKPNGPSTFLKASLISISCNQLFFKQSEMR